MGRISRVLRNRWLAVVPLVAAAALGASGKKARALDEATVQSTERCASRLSFALWGKAPSDALLAKEAPQADVDAMVAAPEFQERFARFLNASFNRAPGETAKEDSAYFLGKYVLEKNLPYRDMFVGPYNVDEEKPGGAVVVKADPNGLGYFRSRPWMKRYAGNESAGYRIVAGYRILNNTVGLKLVATTNAPDVDVTITGRSAPPCAGCHFERWSALDLTARVLGKVKGTGDALTFEPPSDGPQPILDRQIANDRELVETLVSSESFDFNVCRLSFQYLYGRPETACESKTFDNCVQAFKSTGKIQDAVATVAKDAAFCQ